MKHSKASFHFSCEAWFGGPRIFCGCRVCPLPVLGDVLQPAASHRCVFPLKGAGTSAVPLPVLLTLAGYNQ